MDKKSLQESNSLYQLGRGIFFLLFRFLWRTRVVGAENVPLEGGLLFAANHRSFADPPLVGTFSPRMIHFMAKQELFDIPILGFLIRRVNAFPIRRVEKDISAFKTAQRILISGGALILFPEGTRQRAGVFGRPKLGVGMLAIRTQRPVVPVYLHNTDRFLLFRQISVYFGAPLTPQLSEDYQAFTERIMAAIVHLKEVHCDG
jgi:1-acyl-sn-glycerol-3-phosphate acyltransferase